MANEINPYNKDVKYETLLTYWQKQLDGEDDMLKETENVIREQEATRANLNAEEQNLSDKLCARAIEIKDLLKQLDRQRKIVEGGVQLIQAGRNTILVEMSRLSDKQIKSAKKAAKKWEEAKREGIHVTPYKPKERKLKPRFLMPVVVTLANYFTTE